MIFVKLCTIWWTIVFVIVQIEANYQCGIRKHGFVELVANGCKVEEGQWPWHVGLHKKIENGLEYRCGGTLIDQKHVLTAAHCVLVRDTNRAMPIEELMLHFGQNDLSTMPKHVQVRDVCKIIIHPDYSPRRNDIAVLEVRLPVEYTEYVIPVCLDHTLSVDKDLQNLEDTRGWITGWGMTENGTVSSKLRTASLPVVDYLTCVENDPTLFGSLVNKNVFCAGDRNGTTPGTGDSGGGMYFIVLDRWVLRGIVSFAKMKEKWGRVDASKYAVFVNVQRFLTWIREATKGNSTEEVRAKRISEKDSSGLIKKSRNFFETDDNQVDTTGKCYQNNGCLSNNGSSCSSHLCVINNDIKPPYGSGSGGSPLQTFNPRTCSYTVVGIFNGLYFNDNQPTLAFYRVSHLLDWIEEVVWGVRAVEQTTTETTVESITTETSKEVTTRKYSPETDFVFPSD